MIEPPTTSEILGGYKFEWAAEQVVIEVTRLKQVSSGDVIGEIKVSTSSPALHPHLYGPVKFNFLSGSTRKQIANILNEKYEITLWPDILEQLCFYTNERVRRGETVKELWTSNEIQAPRYLLDPLVIEHYPNALFGDPSSSKSTIALVFQQVMQLPWVGNPLGLKPPINSVHCLYLDWETDDATIQWQTTLLERGMDLGVLTVNYRACSLPLAQDVEQIGQWVEDVKAKVIIIDSLGLAAGGELKETAPALSFFAALRKLKTTSLILAHNSKDRESKTRSIYGNQYYTAMMRNIWEIRKSQEPDSDEMDIALYHRKPPPFMKIHQPIGFHVKFDNEKHGMVISKKDPRRVDEFLEQMSSTDRIYEYLREGPSSVKEISESLDIPDNQVRMYLKRLKDRNAVAKSGEQWALAYTD